MYSLLTSRAIIGEIYRRLTSGDDGWAGRYGMRISSKQETESYGWLGMVPAMREWIGGRNPKRLRESTFSITNKDFEATLEVLLKEMRRDSSGQIAIRIGELARRCLRHPAKLMSAKMVSGFTTVCYDGDYFFGTAHAEGDSGVQSNALSIDISTLDCALHGVVTNPSVEEMQQCIMLALQALLGFKDDQGEPMNEDATEFEVQVPTSLWAKAQTAVSAQAFVQGQTNPLKGVPLKLSVVQNPRLNAWTDKFAVFRTDGDTKPFIIQEEVPLEVSAIAEGSELEFKEKKHWYGVDWTGNVDVGFWQDACAVTMT